jgi:glycerophosphoryl diester phosphodiesterase
MPVATQIQTPPRAEALLDSLKTIASAHLKPAVNGHVPPSHDVRSTVKRFRRPPENSMFVSAHRGLTYPGMPENVSYSKCQHGTSPHTEQSRLSMRAAAQAGVLSVEVDIRTTKDGRVGQ